MKRTVQWGRLMLAAALLAACGPAPTGLPPPTGPATAAIAPTLAPTPAASPSALPTPAPPTLAAETATPAPSSRLTICLADEPQSLYLYARPGPERAHVLAALYGGPVGLAGSEQHSALFERLPSLANGDALVNSMSVTAGARVVDAMGRTVTLAPGVIVRGADGETFTYEGGPASLAQLQVTFRLRAGLTWSDGTPLTAHDSVFSYQVARSPEAFDTNGHVAERTASYGAPDDTLVVWTGLPGYTDPQYAAHFWMPLPRHQFAGLPLETMGDSLEANRAPLSWGPFVLAEWAAGQQMVLERNPAYWRAGEGLPRIDSLVFRFLSDPTRVVNDLAAGSCHIAPSGAGFDDALRALAAGDAQPPAAVRVQWAPGDALETLTFGLAPAPGYTRPASAELLADPRVREAVAHCLDRTALAGGLGQAPAAWRPAGHPQAVEGLSPPPFDPARGRSLLAEAGWANTDGAKITLAGGPAQQALLEAAAAQLADNCGMQTATLALTRGELEADWPDGVIFGRRFDLALLGWRSGPGHCALYLSEQIPDGSSPGGANAGGYASAAYDQACRLALSALDPEQAAAADAEAQRLFAADLPAVPLFFRPRLSAVRQDVTGYALGASLAEELSGIAEWDVQE